MRRDSFKTVRFGNQSSRTSSKASSPKTVLQNTPPSNPYRDIQQSFPNQSFFFSHDSIILWILVFSIYHLLAQAYLIFGEVYSFLFDTSSAYKLFFSIRKFYFGPLSLLLLPHVAFVINAFLYYTR